MPNAVMSDDYRKYVLDDLKKYEAIRSPLRAGALERLIVQEKSPFELHPNPADEFSMPAIGPNYGIVNRYYQLMREGSQSVWKEPIMAEKMSPEGYMLLNGHHRWFAAIKAGKEKVPVRVVNLVHEKELNQMLAASDRDKRAVFDLDEVLWIRDGEASSPAEKAPGFFSGLRYKQRLRRYAPILLRELGKMGYDVWVYTAGYYSVEYIQGFFRSYKVKIAGVVNGSRRGKKGGKSELAGMRSAFAKKYRETLHIDLEHLTRICPAQDDFDYLTLEQAEENWSVKVLKAVRSFQ